MHGTIFKHFAEFASARMGSGPWASLQAAVGFDFKRVSLLRGYPDGDLIRAVHALADCEGRPVAELLEDFGRYLAPRLMTFHQALVRREWRALDMVENAGEAIHAVIRESMPGHLPPPMEACRLSPDRVVVMYRSPRKLCALARGLIAGIAGHYGERLDVAEAQCMHHGAQVCELHVVRVRESGSGIAA